MANEDISDKIKNARTMEDIVNLLSILFTNLNNQNELYYDMFLNPVPMDLELERYDENGKLEVVTLPNVAKMRISVYTGKGNPNGVVAASLGSLYIDLTTGDLYYKAVAVSDTDRSGWALIWSNNNLRVDIDYLSPTGNGSQLTNLNADSVTSGTLKVANGGTGAKSLNGILKGNGTNPVTQAVVDVDYLAPSSLIGLVMYCPYEPIPEGWLVCDDTIYDTTVRPELQRLCNLLGNKYGGDGVTTFGVPNMIGRYAKGGTTEEVGETGEGHVGEHEHSVTGTTEMDGAHTHTRGTMEITGGFCGVNNGQADWGAFYTVSGSKGGLGNGTDRNVNFAASRSWTGETSSTPHQHNINFTISSGGAGANEVDHIKLIPIIKY